MEYTPKANKFYIGQVVRVVDLDEAYTVRGIAEFQDAETEYYVKPTIDPEENEFYWYTESDVEQY